MRYFIEFKPNGNPLAFHRIQNDTVNVSEGNTLEELDRNIGRSIDTGNKDFRGYRLNAGVLEYVGNPPPEPGYQLSVTLDKEIISADGQDTVTATVQLRKDGKLSSDHDGRKFHVPILDIGGRKADMLSVKLSGGQGTITWSTKEPGIYTARLDLVRPNSDANMKDNPEVIAQ